MKIHENQLCPITLLEFPTWGQVKLKQLQPRSSLRIGCSIDPLVLRNLIQHCNTPSMIVWFKFCLILKNGSLYLNKSREFQTILVCSWTGSKWSTGGRWMSEALLVGSRKARAVYWICKKVLLWRGLEEDKKSRDKKVPSGGYEHLAPLCLCYSF